MSADPTASEQQQRSTSGSGLLGRGLSLSRRSGDGASRANGAASNSSPARGSSSSAPDGEDGDKLPTYEELRRKEPGRFGRWRGWIEKRGREQQVARSEARRRAEMEGRPTGSSWNLDGHHPAEGSADQPGADHEQESSLLSAGAERTVFERAAQPRREAQHDANQPSLEPGPGEIPLTPSTSIHPIGSRFLAQFTSRPLCAVPLPVAPAKKARYTAGKNVERFLLIGTEEGLFVCDLIPALSRPVNVQTISSSDTKVYQLWKGVGVHQLDIAIEEAQDAASSTSVPGLLIALVTQDSNCTVNDETKTLSKEMRMWPLQALVNLVKWRVFNEESECIDLLHRTTATLGRRATVQAAGTQAYTGLMSLIDKGKGRAPVVYSNISRSLSRRRTPPSASAGPVPGPRGPPPPLPPRSVPPIATTAPSAAPGDEPSQTVSPIDGLSGNLPVQWASTFIPLDFARVAAQGPILFMKLCKAPNPGTVDRGQTVGEGEQELPLGLRRSEGKAMKERRATLYLIVATRAVVFLLQSSPEPQRTWQLYKEMASPFTPKVASLTLCEFRTTIRRSTSTSTYDRTEAFARSVPTDDRSLAVALAMKDHGVLIRVSDLSVKELETPGSLTTASPRNGSMGSRGSRRSLKRQTDETMLGHLSRASMNSAEALIRPRHTRTESRASSFEVESRRPKVSHERRWTGIEEFLIPTERKRGAGMVATCLCTRGRSSYITLSPLGIDDRPSAASNGGPTPLPLRPLHTFTWRGFPEKVRARFVETPLAWAEGFRSDDLFCCVTAFTATGVETAEGFISMDFLASVARDPTSKPKGVFFRPASSASRRIEGSPSVGSSEVSDTSSYDFGSDIGWLCSGGPWFGGASGWSSLERQKSDASRGSAEDSEVDELSAWQEAEDLSNRGDFFFRSAVGDHKLLWIGSGSSRSSAA